MTEKERRSEASLALVSSDERYVNRELSWLSFNERVLQEAENPAVPLYERLKFLAIFSSNLDEFFRVRVASLRSLLGLSKKKLEKRSLDPTELLRRINALPLAQQERFGLVFRGQILPGLRDAGTDLVDELGVDEEGRSILEEYFADTVAEHLRPIVLRDGEEPPFLKDHTVYLVVELRVGTGIEMGAVEPQLGILEVPSPPLPRFMTIPASGGGSSIIFLDDIIRLNLSRVFPEHVIGDAYALKISRDADLYLDDEFDAGLKQAIKRSLKKRETGVPIRFLYDLRSSHTIVNRLKGHLGLSEEDLIPGGRYHNLHDLFALPVRPAPEHENPSLAPLAHPTLDERPSMFDVIREKDRLLHFPYQSYEYVVRLLQEAANDPDVDAIWISLYRVAQDSAIVKALIHAAQNGKDVSAFVEVQARFDEELNLDWAEKMERAGVRTLYGERGIKVHAKLALIRRRESEGKRLYAFLATGNFNEKTSRIYTDHGLMTVDPRLTEEVFRVFQGLAGEEVDADFEHLLVAPHHLRNGFNALIDAEAAAAEQGRPSGITVKMNSLQDRGIIERLYEASASGVPIKLVIRGICCLRPGVEGLSESIEGRSIVDRFLEHSRMFLFHADGADKLYLASADWMTRNLERRVEVAFPIYDDDVRAELRAVLDLQLEDNTKARIIDAAQRNEFVTASGAPEVRSQIDTYRYLEGLLEAQSFREQG